MIGARGPLGLGLLALAGLVSSHSAAAEARRPPNQRLIGAPAALRPVGFIRHGLTPCLAPRKPIHERVVFLWQAAVA
jgi:hypothetical protein